MTKTQSFPIAAQIRPTLYEDEYYIDIVDDVGEILCNLGNAKPLLCHSTKHKLGYQFDMKAFCDLDAVLEYVVQSQVKKWLGK